uniref:Uncharacterized protein n=1 Tax=Cajanus cajan TaxID=3821 RepID=A0A151SAW9_CAJCA|nr:hypothetical protein KK1_026164 [Cajanus cajan]
MGILRPFPLAKGQLKFLLVAVDYFTKWIEACPLAEITAENLQKFTRTQKATRSAKGQWVDELPNILWAYHCTPQSTTQEMPYRLTYRADAMILVEVSETSHRHHTFNSEQNAQETAFNLDLIDELREEARVHEEACKLRASRRYNTRVRPCSFRVGDLVWRLQGEARRDPLEGKLTPNRDGPFRVIEELENRAYRLEELSGKTIP